MEVVKKIKENSEIKCSLVYKLTSLARQFLILNVERLRVERKTTSTLCSLKTKFATQSTNVSMQYCHWKIVDRFLMKIAKTKDRVGFHLTFTV